MIAIPHILILSHMIYTCKQVCLEVSILALYGHTSIDILTKCPPTAAGDGWYLLMVSGPLGD